jgi:alkylation response protein AidB-like acyl-CoA dehydrogenase
MWHYRAPVADMLHLMTRVLDAPPSWSTMPAFDGLDADTAREVLEQAGKFAGEMLAPTNGPGDLAGCTWTTDGVRTPEGFAAAYRTFIDGGWPALACAHEAGGQGLPQLLNMALYEMLTSANHAWMMYPGLLHGAYEVLLHHAVPGLRERYLSKVVSGEWLATMNLTEPQAGSDLGLVRTKAETVAGAAPANGVPVLISGNKIFISGGEHDLTDNIVHLVLCRLAHAPPGTKGLSLAIVPKVLPDGTRNTVFCDGIEKKMGIKGSATCQMRFERAQGWLVGEPNRGLAAMFLMMNAARLQVAMQGVGHLEAATQNAWRYSAERQQMRAARRPTGVNAGAAPAAADPIAWQPSIRRTLLTLQARTDAVRTIAYWTAIWLDESQQHQVAAQREAAAAHVAFLTPIAKAFFTELGHRSADEALGVWGGYGYVHEYGIEQAVRDSRIALIYEGTNQIQAIDLMTRKLLDDGGQRAAALRALLQEEAQACEGTAFGDALAEQLECWRQADAALIDGAAEDSEWPLRVADDYLMAVGHALMAWAWARIARCALDPARAPAAGGRTAAQWFDAARFGVEWLLPQAATHWTRVRSSQAALPFIG